MEWIAYQRIEPDGWHMDNWRMARICESIGNAVLSTIPVPRGKPRPKPFKVADFLPAIESGPHELTPKQAEHIRKKHDKRKRNG